MFLAFLLYAWFSYQTSSYLKYCKIKSYVREKEMQLPRKLIQIITGSNLTMYWEHDGEYIFDNYLLAQWDWSICLLSSTRDFVCVYIFESIIKSGNLLFVTWVHCTLSLPNSCGPIQEPPTTHVIDPSFTDIHLYLYRS